MPEPSITLTPAGPTTPLDELGVIATQDAMITPSMRC